MRMNHFVVTAVLVVCVAGCKKEGDAAASPAPAGTAAAAPAGGIVQGFKDYRHQAMQVEAKVSLEAIARGAVHYYEEERADREGRPLAPRFPVAAELTPSRSCCAQGGRCKPDDAEWQAAPWPDLLFSPDAPHRYRYSFTSSGTGKDATFTARAVGDLDCNGNTDTWQVTGRVGADGTVQTDKVTEVH